MRGDRFGAVERVRRPGTEASVRLPPFATMMIGGGLSSDPAVAGLCRAGAMLADASVAAGALVEISSRYGSRMTATTAGAPMGRLESDHFAEVVDYDPRTNHLTAIGPAEPAAEAPIHWLVYRAKVEVNAMAHVHDEVVLEASQRGAEFTKTVGSPPRDFLEAAMQVLAALRFTNYVVMAGHGSFCAGRSVHEVAKTTVGHHRIAAEFLAKR